MPNRDDAWILDMLLAARKARQFASGANRDTFLADEVLQNAVMRQLQIVGEAASRVSEAGKAAHPSVPWRAIVGMRHRLVHDYVNIDSQLVWGVLENDLEPLIEVLEKSVPGAPGAA
jgi:uncharacterized protein with HEPN domain